MSGKKLLILERSSSDLQLENAEDGSVLLSGVFTQIGVKNKNNRIYEEQEVIPHINELQKKVKIKKLLGELDHPKDFDISLSNVSHVIEDLNYDSDKKQVIGKIRLLNTSKGKEAQALIRDGIPLHISSRAAGTVDESGNVKIKKWFTYDLVADPGFENAELARVNESYGFGDNDNILIYEMNEESKTEIKDNKKEDIMEGNNYVTVEDFQKYTEYTKSILEDLKESKQSTSDNSNNELFDKIIKYTEHIAERVNVLTDYSEYLAENVDKNISYSDYLAENVNKIKDYSKYLAEELDNSIQYSEHIAEKADQGIRFANYLAEELDNSIQYSEYIAEKADQGIQYSNYLAEGLDKSIKYSEYIAENVSTFGNKLNESVGNINETAKIDVEGTLKLSEKTETYKDSIAEKLDQLINKAEKNSGSELNFMNFLTESRKNEFKSLTEEKQALIVESMNAQPLMSTVQVDNIWNSCFSEKPKRLDVVENMPEKYRNKWNKLSEERQKQIIAESKFRKLENQYAINDFWQTRDLRSKQVEMKLLNESVAASEAAKIKDKKTVNEKQNEQPMPGMLSESAKTNLIEHLKFRLGR